MRFVRTRSMFAVAVLAFAVVLAAACSPTAAPAPTSAPPTAVPAPTTAPAPTDTPAEPTADANASMSPGMNPPAAKAIALQLIQNDALGSFLADQDGYALYMFAKDVRGTSNCYDECLKAWPALLTNGETTVGEGLIADLVGTTTRNDGAVQVTYNGWPLYYWEKDAMPGDVTGQGVGDVWWVVSAEGNVIKPSGLEIGENDKYGQFLTDENGMSLYVHQGHGECEQLLRTMRGAVASAVDADGSRTG